MRAHRILATAAAMALLVIGCADDDVTTGDSTTSTTTASSGDTTTTTAVGSTTTTGDPDVTIDDGGIDPLDDADRTAKHGGVADGPVALLTDVRIGRHEGYDRVVFEFRDGLPEWWVEVGEGELTGDPSGLPIELAGVDRLDVRMAAASGVEFTDEDPGYIEVYTGPDRVEGAGSVVTEAVLVGDFEANLLWAIGLGDPVDFRVLEMSDPPRLVVDVRNH